MAPEPSCLKRRGTATIKPFTDFRSWFTRLLWVWVVGALLVVHFPVQLARSAGTAAYLPVLIFEAPSSRIWHPTPGTSWQIQLSSSEQPNLSYPVQVYDLDLFDMPQTAVDVLHADGRKLICYFSAGTWEDWRPDAAQFPPWVIGKPLPDWPGERWLDIRRLDLLVPLMAARLDLAVQKGCDGVDPDNMDGYTQDSGFPLSAHDQLTYNIWITRQAHARGLAVGLKNDLDQATTLLPYFDWAINEQCFQYKECDLLLPFIGAGKPVFGIEYNLDAALFCPQANAMNFDFLKKKLSLDEWRLACR
jgi:hypothetical protein